MGVCYSRAPGDRARQSLAKRKPDGLRSWAAKQSPHSGDRAKTDRAKRDASVVQSIVQGSAQRSFWVSVAAEPVLTVVARLDERLLKVRRRIDRVALGLACNELAGATK